MAKANSNNQEYAGYKFSSSFGNSLVKTTDTLDTVSLTHRHSNNACVRATESDPDCVYDETESDGLFDELNDIFPPDQNDPAEFCRVKPDRQAGDVHCET